MQVQHHKIGFDVSQILREEVPFLNYFYTSHRELNKDITDLLEYPIAHKDAMPFYTIRDSSIPQLKADFEGYYAMMKAALKIAFNDEDLLYRFFDCDFLRRYGKQFVPYARHTFRARHPALYGRFDACFNPEKEKLEGIYEFNGDTPVMLFESVNLQARFSEELGTAQWNDWWHTFQRKFAGKYSNVAVVCHTGYMDDLATCETISQAFAEANPIGSVSFLDLKELDYDFMNPTRPWVSRHSERPLDAVYILLPWEEMVDQFPTMLHNWERWADNVHLFEPAWRWFFAHKGMTALMWHLLSEDDDFWQRHGGRAGILPTYLTWEEFTAQYPHSKSVEKPVVGRLSNNIRIHGASGELIHDTGGYYAESNTIHQHFLAPMKVPGRNNFILGMWMCDDDAVSLCAREFDEEILSTANERFIPHIVLDE